MQSVPPLYLDRLAPCTHAARAVCACTARSAARICARGHGKHFSYASWRGVASLVVCATSVPLPRVLNTLHSIAQCSACVQLNLVGIVHSRLGTLTSVWPRPDWAESVQPTLPCTFEPSPCHDERFTTRCWAVCAHFHTLLAECRMHHHAGCTNPVFGHPLWHLFTHEWRR